MAIANLFWCNNLLGRISRAILASFGYRLCLWAWVSELPPQSGTSFFPCAQVGSRGLVLGEQCQPLLLFLLGTKQRNYITIELIDAGIKRHFEHVLGSVLLFCCPSFACMHLFHKMRTRLQVGCMFRSRSKRVSVLHRQHGSCGSCPNAWPQSCGANPS